MGVTARIFTWANRILSHAEVEFDVDLEVGLKLELNNPN